MKFQFLPIFFSWSLQDSRNCINGSIIVNHSKFSQINYFNNSNLGGKISEKCLLQLYKQFTLLAFKQQKQNLSPVYFCFCIVRSMAAGLLSHCLLIFCRFPAPPVGQMEYCGYSGWVARWAAIRSHLPLRPCWSAAVKSKPLKKKNILATII